MKYKVYYTVCIKASLQTPGLMQEIRNVFPEYLRAVIILI